MYLDGRKTNIVKLSNALSADEQLPKTILNHQIRVSKIAFEQLDHDESHFVWFPGTVVSRLNAEMEKLAPICDVRSVTDVVWNELIWEEERITKGIMGKEQKNKYFGDFLIRAYSCNNDGTCCPVA